jgi:hypothetical protein
MSLTIWKYEIIPTDAQEIEMPEGARILCVQVQNDTPYIWALVNPAAVKCGRRLRIVGTGHTVFGDPGAYIGTFQFANGLVFHVFDQGQTVKE